MKSTNLYIRILTLSLLVLMLLSTLSSCASDSMDNTRIGSIGNDYVYYDELYYVIEGYKDYVKALHPDDKEAQINALDEIFKSSIVKSHATVSLCQKHGLSVKDIKSSEIKSHINDYYGGGQDNFDEQLEANNMSKRLLEYIAATEILYSQRLPAKLIDDGIITQSGNDLKKYVKENFIRVNHLVIINDAGDDVEKNFNKIKEAKALLNSGQYTIEELIGKGYSEDFHDLSGDGYYITKGSMVEAYEKAAFNLELYGISEIVKTVGESNTGVQTECYYLIQRLPMEDKYIDTHIAELEKEYHASIISPLLENEKAELSFKPNAIYERLDLLNLKRPTNGTAAVIAIIVIIIVILITASVIVIIIVKKKLKKKNVSHVSKSKKRNK